MPATVMSAASVAPGLASARTPSGISSRPTISSSHQSGSTSRAANAPGDREGAHHDQPRAEHDGDREQAGLRPDDDQDAGGDRQQAGDHVGLANACVDAGRQRLGEALEDEERSDEGGQIPDRPVDAEDQDAGDDEQCSVEQQQPPVARDLLRGVAGELVTEGHGARGDEHGVLLRRIGVLPSWALSAPGPRRIARPCPSTARMGYAARGARSPSSRSRCRAWRSSWRLRSSLTPSDAPISS